MVAVGVSSWSECAPLPPVVCRSHGKDNARRGVEAGGGAHSAVNNNNNNNNGRNKRHLQSDGLMRTSGTRSSTGVEPLLLPEGSGDRVRQTGFSLTLQSRVHAKRSEAIASSPSQKNIVCNCQGAFSAPIERPAPRAEYVCGSEL
ncbi:hypothetical protein EYF80_039834 [Liparis tanakae]|uniref:Uncharacterized protein n=1 Tax=Liparis tanakae TaxID=230148 RepID=A0A4Z2G8S3_9TELE|nr:hypothetical protein EYF80_039834 [Liparis tanakae]